MTVRRLSLTSAGAACAAVAGVVAAAAWAVGVDAGHVAALALGVAATLLVVRSLGPALEPSWPDEPDAAGSPGWHGAVLQSRLLERLDAEPHLVPSLLLPRLRALLGAALEARSVEPRSAQARRLVGAGLYDLLSTSGWEAAAAPARRPTATDLTRSVLERTDELRG